VNLFINKNNSTVIPESVITAISALNKGHERVCELDNGVWVVQEHLKQAILLFFRYSKCSVIGWQAEPDGRSSRGDIASRTERKPCAQYTNSFDKVPLKFDSWEAEDFERAGIRVVPGAIVRYGAFIGRGAVLMNCFINIGVYIGKQTMIDSFVTIGSCAQIGERCHLAAGSVVGGVLEPINASPVIIEDDCLIGANAVVVEGVRVRRGATIAMGTRIGASTKIIDRQTKEEFHGEIPEMAVVVPGSYESEGFYVACAVIVGYKNRQYLNEDLR
jgi:2,3,4,5-tetrahydropyridine-2,6-dicarboxylate N-succinyltransferase